MDPRSRYEHQILTVISDRATVSQRSLARSVGIALGLTNLLLKRLVRKGWVRISRIRPNRVRYFLTPAGFAEKARLSRLYLQDAIGFYVMARNRIRETLADAAAPATRVVFYGTGEIAEIAFVCLQETNLRLVAVIAEPDQPAPETFLGVPVYDVDQLRDGAVGNTPYDRVVVTSFCSEDAARDRLLRRGVALERVQWL